MRLLHVTQSYYPFLDKGGPTVKVRALAHGMASSGHDVTVLTADLGFDPAKREMTGASAGRWGFEARENGVEVIYLQTRLCPISILDLESGRRRVLLRAVEGYDLKHIYGLYDLIGLRVTRACRRIARPYVVEPMGMFLPIVRTIWMKRLYHDTLGGRLLEGASRVIAISEQGRDEFLRAGIADSKIVVRRIGIDISGQFPATGWFHNQWDTSRNLKLVLSLWRLVSKKSPELMCLFCLYKIRISATWLVVKRADLIVLMIAQRWSLT